MGNDFLNRNSQIGLIAYFATSLGRNQTFGRKAFQKIIHLTSELADVPTGYEFSFYTYGPYSRALASDLELAEDIKVVSSTKDEATGGYDIKVGSLGHAFVKMVESDLTPHKTKLDWISKCFGKSTAKSLELYSTIVFLKRNDPFKSDDEIANQVKKLKPKYELSEINSGIFKINSLEMEARTLS